MRITSEKKVVAITNLRRDAIREKKADITPNRISKSMMVPAADPNNADLIPVFRSTVKERINENRAKNFDKLATGVVLAVSTANEAGKVQDRKSAKGAGLEKVPVTGKSRFKDGRTLIVCKIAKPASTIAEMSKKCKTVDFIKPRSSMDSKPLMKK